MKLVPLRHAAELVLGRQRAPEFEHGDGQTQYLRSANIRDGRVDLNDVKSMRFSRVERLRFGLQPGDVLVTEGSGSRDTVGASAVWMGELEGPVCFQNTLLRLRPRAGVDGRYLAWWARHAHASGLVAAVATGANIQHVGAEALGALTVAVPKLEEQRRIADFLDNQVSVLDEALARARAMLPLLEHRALAWREAVLTELRGTADAMPLRRVMQEIDERLGGRSPLPLLSVSIRGGVQQRRALTEDLPRAEEHSNYKVARRGDIVLNRMRAFQGAVGMAPCDGLVSPDYAVLRVLEPHRAEYVSALVRTSWFTSEMTRRLRGIGSVDQGNVRTPRVNVDDLKDIRLPLPGALDQERWSARLSAGDSVEAGRAAVDVVRLLEERTRALINACVTGEFDVSAPSNRAGDAALARLPPAYSGLAE